MVRLSDLPPQVLGKMRRVRKHLAGRHDQQDHAGTRAVGEVRSIDDAAFITDDTLAPVTFEDLSHWSDQGYELIDQIRDKVGQEAGLQAMESLSTTISAALDARDAIGGVAEAGSHTKMVYGTYGEGGQLEALSVLDVPKDGEWHMSYMAVAPWNNHYVSEVLGQEPEDDKASQRLAIALAKDAIRQSVDLVFEPASAPVARLYRLLGARPRFGDSITGKKWQSALIWPKDAMRKFVERYDKTTTIIANDWSVGKSDFSESYPQPLGPTELLTATGRYVFWRRKQRKKLEDALKLVKMHLPGKHDQKTHGRQTETPTSFIFNLPVTPFSRSDTEEDWANLNLRMPTDEELKQTYDMDLPKYEIEVIPHPEDGSGSIEVRTMAYNKEEDGNEGQQLIMIRKFKKDWEGKTYVYHESFDLPTQYQGKGMAADVLERSEVLYKKLGVERIELVANASVGRYAWARMGFDFAGEYDKKNVLTEDHGPLHFAKNFTQYLDHFDIPADKRPTINHTWELAAWKARDDDGPWKKIGIQQAPSGKNFLLLHSASYNAMKMLNDNDIGYRIGQAYYRLKKEKKNARRT